MEKDILLQSHADNIKNVVSKKRHYDLNEAERFSKNLRSKYIEVCRKEGIRNSFFEKRIERNSVELDLQLKKEFDDSTRSVVNNLNEVFSEMQEELVAKNYNNEEKSKKVVEIVDMFFENSEKEINNLLEKFKVKDSEAIQLKMNLKKIMENIKVKSLGEIQEYGQKMDNVLIQYVKTELNSFKDEVFNLKTHDKSDDNKKQEKNNDLSSTLKGYVRSSEEVADIDIDNSLDENNLVVDEQKQSHNDLEDSHSCI